VRENIGIVGQSGRCDRSNSRPFSLGAFYAQREDQTPISTGTEVNAAQAIKKDGEITVTTGCVDDTIVISIADNGCGIAEEHLTKIFDPLLGWE